MLWYLFLLVTVRVSGSKSVWLIRHCDKPSDDSSNCCSSTGYDRAKAWASYFKGLINSDSTAFVASNYADQGSCKKTLGSPSPTYPACQHSQRMWLTASEITNQMGLENSLINTDYCTADSMKDVAKLVEKQSSESLVVWEHKQIPDIINELGVKLSAWPDNLDYVYNLVFRVSNGGGLLEYTCYNYDDGSDKCDKGVDSWLKNYASKMVK